MRSPISRSLQAAALLAVLAACGAPAGTPAPAPGPAVSTALVDEARAFMDAYAVDLRAGDREAVAARYDRRGAYAVGNGHKSFDAWENIRARYQSQQWQPPARFEWRDLSYEVLGPETVAVVGKFAWWTERDPQPVVLSYTGLLLRQDGQLRIRLEDESVDPRTLPAPPCKPDSARG